MISRLSSPQFSRILAISMTVVLLLAVMTPAVFATSGNSFVYELTEVNYNNVFTYIDSYPPEGTYLITLDCLVELEPGVFEIVTVSFPGPVDIVYEHAEGLVLFSGEFTCTMSLAGNSEEGLFTFQVGQIWRQPVICFVAYGEPVLGTATFTLVPESSAVSQFMVYTTTTLSAVVSWFGNLIDSFIGENGALSVLFPFVAIGFTIALVYFCVKLVRQFVPGF